MNLKVIVISLILMINVIFGFTLLLSTFYQSEDENTSKFSTLISFFSGKIQRSDTDFTNIIQLLKQDKDIETKTIMAFSPAYSFHTNSNFIFTSFDEGEETDTVEDFITRKNWSEFEHWLSSNNSIPPHKDISHQIPDYLIYAYSNTVIDPDTTWYFSDQNFYIHSLLINPEDPGLQKFLNLVYSSNSGRNGIIIYEINFQE